MKRGTDVDESKNQEDDGITPLCASCDRCRARKTRCDGQRPCSNCCAKYMKTHKLTSIDGVDPADIECEFSPAKRRGPVPGRVGQGRKGHDGKQENMNIGMNTGSMQPQGVFSSGFDDAAVRQMLLQQQPGMGFRGGDAAALAAIGSGLTETAGGATSHLQQLNYLQQLGPGAMSGLTMESEMNGQGRARRVKTENADSGNAYSPDTVAAHMPLLGKDSTDGNRLRAFYRLSVDELFVLPPIPTDEEYCTRNNVTPSLFSGSHKHALNAARFAEIALGALVHNEIALAMELCNATVHSLRECAHHAVQPQYCFEVARAYFLLGLFRAFRGDMVRYFKYRRVCMSNLTKMENDKGLENLLAAMAYLDAWAYMMYNANENKLPNIDDSIPRVCCGAPAKFQTETEREYGVYCGASAIASDPKNQMWIQGAPPVYLNNEAPLNARSLDAVACAIRSCCDQANSRFAMMSQAATPNGAAKIASDVAEETMMTATNSAVLAHENELCSRNIVLSAHTLLQQHEATTATTTQQNQGHHLIISALDAFLDGGDEDGSGGFTDGQVQSLLSVCNTAIENPLLLHHAGPTYHMVSNAAILLCHLMNGMHAMDASSSNGTSREMEAAVFEEVLDTFLSVRKLLNIHRRKLPVQLRCHAIPRPSMRGPLEGQPFIDLGETLMCGCRGCQGFVLMACSPCVAAERAKAAQNKREFEYELESESMLDNNDLDRALIDLESEFDLDDDALLNMLSSIVAS